MDPIAAHDQAREDIKQKARLVGAYWVGLRAEGVDSYDATELALSLQEALLPAVYQEDASC